jgi:peptidyl-dipeptidase Dcp
MKLTTVTLLASALFLFGCTQQQDMENPFYSASTLPFEAPDFNQIDNSHYKPAFEKGMEQQLQEIEVIAALESEPTFENTIVAMERER